MDFIQKIQRVKDILAIHSEHHGESFDYFVDDLVYVNELEGHPNYGDETIYIHKSEHQEIINYLADTLYLNILGEKGKHLQIKLLDPAKAAIKPKTLELMARELKDYYTGVEIVELLKECGVDSRLIIYPESKWAVFYKVFNELNYHRNPKDSILLYKIICEAIHPINVRGNQELSNELQIKFNKLLEYDDLHIEYIKQEKVYKIYGEPDDEVEAEMHQEVIKEAEAESIFLALPDNVEKISLLRKSFQTFLNVVELFCADPSHPTSELNDAYNYLDKQINSLIKELGLDTWTLNDYHLWDYRSPFSNLFRAEKYYGDLRAELSWEAIRPRMNAAFGDIEEIYRKVNGSDILAEPDKQKEISKIELFLSTQKKKRKIANKMRVISSQKLFTPATKIEITSLPELQIKGFEEKVVLQKPQNKKIQLRKFPLDLRWEEISIQFLNGQEVIITARKETHQTNYEAMGFQDNKQMMPNKQWQLLQALSLNNGELNWNNNHSLELKEINKIKKRKQILSSCLKAYFQINDDPFDDYKTDKSYRIRLNLMPEQC